MGALTPPRHANLLVGFESWDDAGVYRLSDDLALVQTVDFFTPIVDDPTDFGAVAAANAMSDVYAMGGEPLTALGIVGFPHDQLPLDVLGACLRGAQLLLEEAGVPLVGGHTVKDREFKLGFAITGKVHPGRVVTNAGAQPGDRLLLSKPLGTGILSTAIKRDRLDQETTEALVASMRRLNRSAAAAMTVAGARAATDITGYGLVGHLRSMARASSATFEIEFARVPALPRATELLAEGIFPGGLLDNIRAVAPEVEADTEAHPDWRLLFDPQTSGGLCVALPEDRVERFQATLAEHGEPPAAPIGKVIKREAVCIRVVP